MHNKYLHLICQEPQICETIAGVSSECGFETYQSNSISDAMLSFAKYEPLVVIIDTILLKPEDITFLRGLTHSASNNLCLFFILLTDPKSKSDAYTTNFLATNTLLIQVVSLSKISLKKPLKKHLEAIKSEAINLTKDELLEALTKEQLLLFYQPKVCLNTQQISGAEALIRWQHPIHGLISPRKLINLAEDFELMPELTKWTISTCCKQMAAWKQANINLTLSLNLSEIDLQTPSLTQTLIDCTHQYSVDPQKIFLEIPEETVVKYKTYQSVLNNLSKANFKLSIDNCSLLNLSLYDLQKIPFSELKISKHLILELNDHEETLAICKCLVDIGHNMNYIVTAIGLETAEAWQQLTDLNCDTGQGFYVSRPISVAEFNKWLLLN